MIEVPKTGTASRLPVARKIVAPLPGVSSSASVISPLVNVRAPPTDTAPPRVMPLPRLTVRLFSSTVGRVVAAPLPFMTMFADAPPVSPPAVWSMAPLSVSVFAPIERLPLASAKVSDTVTEPLNETPALLVIVRLLAPVSPLPESCATVPSYT